MSKRLMRFIMPIREILAKTGQITWEKDIKAKELGLIKCEVCGEYKSKRAKDNVLCSCSDVLCSKCKVNKIPRPVSNLFSEEDGKILHVPYFLYRCKDCR